MSRNVDSTKSRAILQVLIALTLSITTHAQSADPRDFLTKGIASNGLTGTDVPAWHLKANYTLFDSASGKPNEAGTLEEWYLNPSTWLRVYTEKSGTSSEWSTARATQFRLKDNQLNLAELDRRVAIPLTDPTEVTINLRHAAAFKLEPGYFRSVSLRCVVAANPSQAAGPIDPEVLLPRMCFDTEKSTLRFVKINNVLIVYALFKPWGKRSIATKVDVRPSNHDGSEIEITTLEPLAPADRARLSPPSNVVQLPWIHQPGDPPLVPAHLTACDEPTTALNRREAGLVTVPIIILKDGSVRSEGPASGPHYRAEAAAECVNSWKFKPFRVGLQTVEVSDSILYNFDAKPFTPASVIIASQPPPPVIK